MSDWVQITLNEALQAYLKGRTVKVVDLSADVIMSLAEVLERFQQGAMLMAEAGAVEEAVEEDPKQLMKENTELRNKLNQMADEYSRLSTQYAELNAAYQIAKHPAPAIAHGSEKIDTEDYDRHDPTASAAIFGTGDGLSHAKEPKPVKQVRSKKTVEQMEAEYQKRGISDIPKLKALREAGWSMAKIAVEFGCCPQTVANTMKREGIA